MSGRAGSVPAEAVARALQTRIAEDALTIAAQAVRIDQLEIELTDARAQRPSEEPAK